MLRCVVWILAGIGLALSLSGSAQATTLSIIQITSTGQDFLRSNGTPSNTAHVDTVDITVTGGDFLTQFDLTTSAGTFSTLNFTLDGSTFYNALVPGLPITLTLLESVGSYTATINYQCNGSCSGGSPGSYAFDVKTLSAVTTPIPAAALLFGSGLLVLGLTGRKRIQQQD